MKLSAVAVLIAGAGLATVNASPLRVTIVSSHVESFGNLPVIPQAEGSSLTPFAEWNGRHHHASGETLEDRLARIQEWREAHETHNKWVPENPIPIFVPVEEERVIHHDKHHSASIHCFMKAFMGLKWWEGGAIAFVFGCGIGVLLRMVWVMAVVSYRVGFRGESVDNVYDNGKTVSSMAPPQYTEAAPEKDSFPEEKTKPAA